MYVEELHSGIVKVVEGNFHQGIKLDINYFSLTHQNIKAVMLLFSVYLPSVHACKEFV